MKHTVQVTILGQQFSIKSETSPEEVKKVVAFVNERLAEVGGSSRVADSLNTAILTLLNVAGSYLRACDQEREQQKSLHRLAKRLERACGDSAGGAGTGSD